MKDNKRKYTQKEKKEYVERIEFMKSTIVKYAYLCSLCPRVEGLSYDELCSKYTDYCEHYDLFCGMRNYDF